MLALLSFFICDQGRCQDEQAVNELEKLSAQVGQVQAPIPEPTLEDVAKKFTSILPNISFEPNFKAPPSINEITPNGVTEIKETTKIALALINSNSLKTGLEKNISNPSLTALESYLVKLNEAIDPNWKSLRVSANVMPPSGTPNAAAGMNPEAIADPDLKQQYLDLIKKNRDNNLKNGQQRTLRESRNILLRSIASLILTSGEGLDKAAVVARFCKDDESKIILEQHLKQNE